MSEPMGGHVRFSKNAVDVTDHILYKVQKDTSKTPTNLWRLGAWQTEPWKMINMIEQIPIHDINFAQLLLDQ